jgi:hypothetical protein
MATYQPNKAISTRYHGYNFRSRLEARWAVVFETLGLNWRYEAEGWQSPSGDRWLPDFLLEIQGKKVWVEIKPPGHGDEEVLGRMAEGMSGDEYIWAIAADIPDPKRLSEEWDPIWQGHYGGSLEGQFDMFFRWRLEDGAEGVGQDNNYYLCICVDCSTVGIQFDRRSARIDCGCPKGGPEFGIGDKNYTSSHPTILKAYAAARAARFEHDDREVW